MTTLATLAADLASGKTTARELVETCLARIADTTGEGSHVFIKVNADQARVSADFHDRMRRNNAAASPFAGIPLSVKDLCDIAGDVTTAGSVILADRPPASEDAVCIARLRAAGFIPIGRTNMTEFAFSAIGINPHYGTPLNPYDRAHKRVPGGSSSGAAVSIADGMAYAAVGSDTGGSCRVPAAFCGVVGYKPTASRVPKTGVIPLSATLDSVGPLANSVRCCATIDAFLAGETDGGLADIPLKGSRLALPNAALNDLEPSVAASFQNAVAILRRAGADIVDLPLPEFAEIPKLNSKGGFSPVESLAYHHEMIAKNPEKYDPRILVRILRGKEQSPEDYQELRRARADFVVRMTKIMAPFDALLTPTSPMVAPKISDLSVDQDFFRINADTMRFTIVGNFIDGCSISIPCHRAEEAPTGIMLTGTNGKDRHLLAIAAAVESAIASSRL